MWRLLKEPFLATWKGPKDATRARWLLKEPFFDVPGSASKFEYRLISRTSYCPRLISLLVVGGEKTSLGGEYVGGEIVPWWRVRWWRVCLVAR